MTKTSDHPPRRVLWLVAASIAMTAACAERSSRPPTPGCCGVRVGRLLAVIAVLSLVFAGSASAAGPPARSTTDATDVPAGPQGKTDLRSVAWAVGRFTSTQTVSVDESTYVSGGSPARLGVHVLLDSDRDGLADSEVAATRNADGVSVDMALRSLSKTASTGECQDLAGTSVFVQGAVSTTTENALETLSFTFNNGDVPGGLSGFRWLAFGQTPPEEASGGPWDYVPDAANPDPEAVNPGDRRCASEGLRASMNAGIEAPVASTFQQTRQDPSDAPPGSDGRTDLRSLTWDVGATTTTLTVVVDESVVGPLARSELGLHILVDSNDDGLADAAVVGTRNPDGTSVDMSVRRLQTTNSSTDCQDLADGVITAQTTVASTTVNGLETIVFTFATDAIPGGLSRFRWVAFGQSPPGPASSGPWDYSPDAANPDLAAANPGPRSCGLTNEGLALRMSAGVEVKNGKPKGQ